MVLRIMPHGRLQEWVAHDEGYFTAEGLEYTFVPEGDYGIGPQQRDDRGEIRTGAFETFDAGRAGANVSCACHWATNAAASERAGQLVTTAYSVAPAAIVVPPDSAVRQPEDLAGVPVGVGYHSGSHFATLQALESVLAPDQIALTFQGPPNERLDTLVSGQVPAATVWGVPLYIAEALGFRRILDATFMIGFLVTGDDVSATDVERYLAALRRAQMAIDLHPEKYKHHHLRAVPEAYRDRVDVRSFGTGPRRHARVHVHRLRPGHHRPQRRQRQTQRPDGRRTDRNRRADPPVHQLPADLHLARPARGSAYDHHRGDRGNADRGRRRSLRDK
jgi:NitT/TauT family transport system substrate-binding protein